jgi:hypothetical protein
MDTEQGPLFVLIPPIQSTVSGAGNWRAGRGVFVPDYQGWRCLVSQVNSLI